jgi:hypothetical protein
MIKTIKLKRFILTALTSMYYVLPFVNIVLFIQIYKACTKKHFLNAKQLLFVMFIFKRGELRHGRRSFLRFHWKWSLKCVIFRIFLTID